MKKVKRSIHDILFRKLLQNMDTARAFIKHHFAEHRIQNLDLSTLTPADTANVDDSLNILNNDVIFTCKTKENKDIFVILVIEHQSKPDKKMAFRLLRYKLQILSRYENKDKFPNFLSTVLFHDKTPYPYSRSIFDCFQDPEWAKEDLFEPFDLVDLRVMSNEEILKDLDKDSLLKYLLKHSRDKDFVLQFMELLEQYPILFSSLTQDELIAIFEYATNVKVKNANQVPAEELLKVASKALGPEKSDTIMSIAQQLRQEGKQEGLLLGIKKGIEKGIEKGGKIEGKIETTKNMLSLGLDIDLIQKATGLSLDQIKELKR